MLQKNNCHCKKWKKRQYEMLFKRRGIGLGCVCCLFSLCLILVGIFSKVFVFIFIYLFFLLLFFFFLFLLIPCYPHPNICALLIATTSNGKTGGIKQDFQCSVYFNQCANTKKTNLKKRIWKRQSEFADGKRNWIRRYHYSSTFIHYGAFKISYRKNAVYVFILYSFLFPFFWYCFIDLNFSCH